MVVLLTQATSLCTFLSCVYLIYLYYIIIFFTIGLLSDVRKYPMQHFYFYFFWTLLSGVVLASTCISAHAVFLRESIKNIRLNLRLVWRVLESFVRRLQNFQFQLSTLKLLSTWHCEMDLVSLETKDA